MVRATRGSKPKRRPQQRRVGTTLNAIYNDIKNASSFSSPYNLYKAAVKINPKIRLKDVKEWLEGQDTYTLNRRAVHRYERRKTLVPNINEQWQADIAYFHQFKGQNNNLKYLLVVIDCFSRFCFLRALKNKSCKSVTDAFVEIMKVGDCKPKWLQTDLGTEFYGETFQLMLIENDIHHFSTSQPPKATLAERFILTLRRRLSRYFTHYKTHRYIDVLPQILMNYNNTGHQSLGGYAPSEVNKKTWADVYEAQYRKYLGRRQKVSRFKVNDKVRISVTKEMFEKSHNKTFSDDTCTVLHVLPTKPPSYYLLNKDGIALTGAAYEPELQLVREGEK